jgi:hypothetical protein
MDSRFGVAWVRELVLQQEGNHCQGVRFSASTSRVTEGQTHDARNSKRKRSLALRAGNTRGSGQHLARQLHGPKTIF